MWRRNVLAIVVLGCFGISGAAPQTHLNCLLRQGSTLWAGSFGEGLFRSDDDGRSWVGAPLPADVTRVLSLAGGQSGRIIAGTESAGVWKSDDRGKSWDRWDVGLPDRVSVEALFTDRAELALAGTTDDGLFQRGPREDSWHRTTTWPSTSAVSAIVGWRDVIFVGTSGNGLFRTEDHGKTWVRCLGIPETMSIAAIGADDGGRVVVGSVEGAIYGVDPLSRSWARIATGDLGASLYQLQLLRDGHIVAATSRGVLVTQPGTEQWIEDAGGEEPMLGCVLWKTDDSGFHVVRTAPISAAERP